MIRPYDTWALARLVAGGDVNGELEHVSSPQRRLCDHLATLPAEARQPALTAFLKNRPEAEEQAVILALADIDPEGPPPPPEAKRLTAHLGDLTACQSAGRFMIPTRQSSPARPRESEVLPPRSLTPARSGLPSV